MKFDYTVTTQKNFDAAVASVQEEIVNAGFRVLYTHDVQQSLAEKGFVLGPMKIIEFCSAKSAYAMLQEDIKIGLCMPCKINVYSKDGRTVISGMRPIVLREFFPNAALGALPDEVDASIKRIIDSAR